MAFSGQSCFRCMHGHGMSIFDTQAVGFPRLMFSYKFLRHVESSRSCVEGTGRQASAAVLYYRVYFLYA